MPPTEKTIKRHEERIFSKLRKLFYNIGTPEGYDVATIIKFIRNVNFKVTYHRNMYIMLIKWLLFDGGVPLPIDDFIYIINNLTWQIIYIDNIYHTYKDSEIPIRNLEKDDTQSYSCENDCLRLCIHPKQCQTCKKCECSCKCLENNIMTPYCLRMIEYLKCNPQFVKDKNKIHKKL